MDENRAEIGTCNNSVKHSSTQKVEKAKAGLDKSEVQLEKMNKKFVCAADSLSLERSRAEMDILDRRFDGLSEYDRKVIQQACKRLIEGVSIRTVACDVGVSESTVNGWRNRYLTEDEQKELKTRQLSKNENTRLKSCNNKQGATTKFLAERYGTIESTIGMKDTTETLKDTQNGGYGDETIRTVCKELKEDITKADFASEVDVPYKAVNTWQQKYLLAKFQEITTPEGTTKKYDGYPELTACNYLKQEETLDVIAEELDIPMDVSPKWESENTGSIVSVPTTGCEYEEESVPFVERKLEIAPELPNNWKNERYQSEQPKTSARRKYDKVAVLRACELLKSGEKIKEVGQKYHTFSAGLRRAKNSRNKKLISEAYQLIEQGDSVNTVARKLKIKASLVYFWRSKYFVSKETKKFSLDYGKITKQQNNSSDVNSKSQPAVIIEEDRQQIDHLCQTQSVHPDSTTGGRLDRNSMQKACRSMKQKVGKTTTRFFIPLRKVHFSIRKKMSFLKMIDEGTPVWKLSKDLNVNELIVRSWILNRELLMKSMRGNR